MKGKTLKALVAIVALLLTACTGGKVYDHFCHTPAGGWEKNDTLAFDVNRLTEGGSYQAQVGLRIDSRFPFKALTLIVSQHVIPSGQTFVDTLRCDLISEKGKSLGHGVGNYQYVFPLRQLPLSSGDSLHVVIRHDMMREIMPGITDVGYQLRLGGR